MLGPRRAPRSEHQSSGTRERARRQQPALPARATLDREEASVLFPTGFPVELCIDYECVTAAGDCRTLIARHNQAGLGQHATSIWCPSARLNPGLQLERDA